MILTIDTDKEDAETLRRVARWLDELASGGAVVRERREASVEVSPEMLGMFQDMDRKPEPAPRPGDPSGRVIPY